jgi:alpha-ketoglutarate-dependent 2,4-dichlorophenoxyacetate dioxygenase
MNPAAGTPFARQPNLDIKTGDVIPAGDRRMVYQLANMLWHSDSSFKPVPSLCSLLSARIVPPEGGATEFASMRAVRRALRRDEAARRGAHRGARLRVVARSGPARLLHRA